MEADSIFKTASLGQNWIAETFGRIDRGEASEIGNNKARVSEIPVNFFKALATAIELARKGEADDIVHASDDEYLKGIMAKKLALFKAGALMSITLTKSTGQLRGWIAGPRLFFWEDGSHVDEYTNNGVFDVRGNFAELMGLAEKYLTGKMRRFEDDKFVDWI